MAVKEVGAFQDQRPWQLCAPSGAFFCRWGKRTPGARAGDEPSVVTKGAWFAAELAGKAKAALGGAPERGPTTAPPRSVSEAVDRIKLDYEGPEGPYFLTGKMDAGCCR